MTVPKPCVVEGCSLPKARPSHRCVWHRLEREPIDRQVSSSKARLASVPEESRQSRVDDALWPPNHRWCAGCQTFVPLFYARGSRCAACASASAHGAMIERTYDLTADQYAALLELQDGRCAVCRAKPRTVRLAVDHDHVTGRSRGLLCSRCNHELLGAAHDSLDLLKRAVAYLEQPPASGAWSAPRSEVRSSPMSEHASTILGTIPYELTAQDGYRFSGSVGDQVIYVLKSMLEETPF